MEDDEHHLVVMAALRLLAGEQGVEGGNVSVGGHSQDRCTITDSLARPVISLTVLHDSAGLPRPWRCMLGALDCRETRFASVGLSFFGCFHRADDWRIDIRERVRR
jgi:hypothetical protein